MTKEQWWAKQSDETKRELKNNPKVAKAMYENSDWPEFAQMVYEMRDFVGDVARVRVK